MGKFEALNLFNQATQNNAHFRYPLSIPAYWYIYHVFDQSPVHDIPINLEFGQF